MKQRLWRVTLGAIALLLGPAALSACTQNSSQSAVPPKGTGAVPVEPERAPVGPVSPAPSPNPQAQPAPTVATPLSAQPTSKAATPGPTTAPAQPPTTRWPCMDIRAALVRCKEGEKLTHEGCPEPAYNQRCAPAR